jgi:hypothetical protein
MNEFLHPSATLPEETGLIEFPQKTRFLWGKMEKINVHSVYEFANAIHPVTTWGETSVGDFWFALYKADTAISDLLQKGEPVIIKTSRQAAVRLKAELDTLTSKFYQDGEGKFAFPEDAFSTRVPEWQFFSARNAALEFEVVFRAEMEGAPVYAVAKKRNYDVADLVDGFDSGLPSELKHIFGEKALNEYRAAGRCYAFGLSTAAGFHACRAVEEVLVNYHNAFCGETPGRKTWGELIKRLNGCADPKPNAKTVGHLDLMRENDRNPIMHPRIELSDSDADALLGLAKATMVFMAQEMAALKGEGAQKALEFKGDGDVVNFDQARADARVETKVAVGVVSPVKS